MSTDDYRNKEPIRSRIVTLGMEPRPRVNQRVRREFRRVTTRLRDELRELDLRPSETLAPVADLAKRFGSRVEIVGEALEALRAGRSGTRSLARGRADSDDPRWAVWRERAERARARAARFQARLREEVQRRLHDQRLETAREVARRLKANLETLRESIREFNANGGLDRPAGLPPAAHEPDVQVGDEVRRVSDDLPNRTRESVAPPTAVTDEGVAEPPRSDRFTVRGVLAERSRQGAPSTADLPRPGAPLPPPADRPATPSNTGPEAADRPDRPQRPGPLERPGF